MKAIFQFTVKTISVLLSVAVIVIFSLVIFGTVFINERTDLSESVLSSIFTFSENKSTAQAVFNDSEETDSDNSDSINLFGTIPVKNLDPYKYQKRYVAVGGELVGIKLKTMGVMIVGTENVETENGTVNPAETADIRIGDTLISIDGYKISTNAELSEIIRNSEGKTLKAELMRENQSITTELTPVLSVTSGIYKCGIWIRDSTGGIGTLTYSDPETGAVVSLGHGIYDVDTKQLMNAEYGQLVNAHLNGITKGVTGTAGEIRGSLGTENIGEIISNRENGLYSKLTTYDSASEFLPVADINEIQTGPAKIISTVTHNGKQYFDIEIEKIYKDKECKNLIIKITDEKLLNTTGGIIQGMSGSPIIQNGMFVGAVTHVFINDPTKGYGISADNMLSTSDNLMNYKETDTAA